MTTENLSICEFEVPFGVEKYGVMHNQITMRRITAEDLIRVSGDHRLKQLKREGNKVNVDADGTISTHGGYDAVGTLTAQSAALEMNATIYALTVTKVGDLQTIDKSTFKKMSPEDLQVIEAWHGWLNTPPKKREDNPDEVDAKEATEREAAKKLDPTSGSAPT